MVGLFAMSILNGCGYQAGNLSGQLLLEGQPIPGELLFELLNQDQQSVGQSITAYADAGGMFQTVLPASDRADQATQLRIVIRATPPTESGIPGTFDSSSGSEKVVTLTRSLPIDSPLVLALTR